MYGLYSDFMTAGTSADSASFQNRAMVNGRKETTAIGLNSLKRVIKEEVMQHSGKHAAVPNLPRAAIQKKQNLLQIQ